MKTTDQQRTGHDGQGQRNDTIQAANPSTLRAMPRAGRMFAALGVVLACSSCVAGVDPLSTASIAKQRPVAAKTQAMEKGAPELAMVKLSGLSAPVTGYRHNISPTSAFQTLYYPTSGKLGDNSLAIEIGLSDSDRFRQVAMSDEAGTEMKKLFPGVRMTIDTTIHQNAYGQFGVATGTLGKRGGTCVYAWQAVKDTRAFKTAVSLSDKSELQLPVRVTLRYCDTKAGPEQLAGLMRTLSISPLTSRSLDLLR